MAVVEDVGILDIECNIYGNSGRVSIVYPGHNIYGSNGRTSIVDT